MRLRPSHLIMIAALTGVALIAIWTVSRSRREAREVVGILSRYEELRTAMASANTNAARELFAPELRGGAHRSLALLQTFSKPLGPQSAVTRSGSRAWICPERLYHFGNVPGGHTIEMVQIEGNWFFTGAVSVD